MRKAPVLALALLVTLAASGAYANAQCSSFPSGVPVSGETCAGHSTAYCQGSGAPPPGLCCVECVDADGCHFAAFGACDDGNGGGGGGQCHGARCTEGASTLRDGAPASYRPVKFPDPTRPTMPLKGLNGTGAGYCVTILGTDLRVEVPGHILDPVKREEFNRRAGLIAQKLPTDPGTIILEYRASVQNAFRLAASMSGRADLIAAADMPLQFEDLGDVEPLRGSKPPKATCMKSSCFGQPSSCVPTGCSGGCADCVGIRVPSAQ